ncbi:cache domain-containing protein, partial [Chromobacterium amazonense]
YVAHDIDEKVAQREMLLNRLARDVPRPLLKDPARLEQWLRGHYDYQPLFSIGMLVLGLDGMAIADYPIAPGRRQISFADRDYFHAALSGRSYIGKATIGRATKVPVLPMSVPIRGADGRVQGVLVGVTALGAPGFLELMQHSRIGNHQDSFLLISPRDGQFVAASEPDMILKALPPPSANPLHDKAMSGWRGAGITINAKGVEEVCGVASVPSTGWFVMARIPSKEAFATVDRVKQFTLRNTLLALGVFTLITCCGMYIVLRPLFVTARHADR